MKQIKQNIKCFLALVMIAGCLLVLTACDSEVKSTDPVVTDNANAASYTVTLDPNGGMFDGSGDKVEVTVKEGTAVDFAAYTPVYEGNTLYGWYLSDGSPWPGARKVTGDVTLRAKWSVTEEEVTYKLALLNGEDPVSLEYDNGVYQFTIVSAIYGGYAQRSGKYTVFEDQLMSAVQADDGSVPRLLYRAESNYVDATGTIYAEFYNDGEFDLFYDYTTGGDRTKYCMGTGYWTYEGYTPPFDPTPLAEDVIVDGHNMGAPSAHTDWDVSLVDGDAAPSEQPSDNGAEPIPEAGEVIFTADADNSETMKANFSENGVLAIFMSSYGANVDATYLWSLDENGSLTITHAGGPDNLAVDNGDGTCTLADDYENTYTIDVAGLAAAISE